MNWEEYKQRKEAQKYFRQGNDMFLSTEQWIKTICGGLLGAILLGIVHGALTMATMWSFSFLYIVIGYAIANIVTSVSGVSSRQMGVTSAILTFISFFVSEYTMMCSTLLIFGLSVKTMMQMIIPALFGLFNSGILTLIFMVVGIFVAYQQAE